MRSPTCLRPQPILTIVELERQRPATDSHCEHTSHRTVDHLVVDVTDDGELHAVVVAQSQYCGDTVRTRRHDPAPVVLTATERADVLRAAGLRFGPRHRGETAGAA